MKRKIYYIVFSLVILLFSCNINDNNIYHTVSDNPNIKYGIINGNITIYNSDFKKYHDELNSHEYFSKGMEAVRNRNLMLARDEFNKVLILYPENVIVLNNLGLIEYNEKNFNKAEYFYNKAINISDSTYYPSIMNLGDIYSLTGEFNKGELLFKSRMENESILFYKGVSSLKLTILYLNYGEVNKAKKYLVESKKYLNKEKFFDEFLDGYEKEIKNYYK